jgi:hypothetical protein
MQACLLRCLTPILLSCCPGVGLAFIIADSCSRISAAGVPDYYAHFRERAPWIVRKAQDLHLLLTPADHEAHHKQPRTKYAYFSPLTSWVQDSIKFWDFMDLAVELTTGSKAMPVPVLEDHDDHDCDIALDRSVRVEG